MHLEDVFLVSVGGLNVESGLTYDAIINSANETLEGPFLGGRERTRNLEVSNEKRGYPRGCLVMFSVYRGL